MAGYGLGKRLVTLVRVCARYHGLKGWAITVVSQT
jgi:hypothetical protein